MHCLLIPLIALLCLPVIRASSATCSFPLPSSRYTFGIPSWQSQNFSCSGSLQAYIIKPSPGKGMGVFAARALEPGDTVLRERPIIKVRPPEFRDGAAYPLSTVDLLVRQAFEALSEDDKAEVLALTAHTTADETEASTGDGLLQLFRTNAYTLGDEMGLFPKTARINHSCRPNTGYVWDERLNTRFVYVTRRIEEGEEIFFSYIPLLHSHADRQRRLEQYGFKCDCEACSGSKSAIEFSDRRRNDIQAILSSLEPQLSLAMPTTVMGKRRAKQWAHESLKLIKLVEAEALANYYAQAYRVAAICHARIADWEHATLWAHKSFQLREMADPKSHMAREMQVLTSSFIASWNDSLRNKSLAKS